MASVIRRRPVDCSVAADSGYTAFDTSNRLMNLVPNALWYRLRRVCNIYEVTPYAICRQREGADNIYWLHDRPRGVLLGWNSGTDDVSEVRLLPTSPGVVTPTASSSKRAHTPDLAFDGDYDTYWQPGSENSAEWLQATFEESVNIDSVLVAASDVAGGQPTDLGYVRGIRIRVICHQDSTRTAAAICQEMVGALVAHNINRAYVFAYEGVSPYTNTGAFWFDTGTPDYVPFGSDQADFLATFIPLANAAGIEVFASLPYIQSYHSGHANSWGLEKEDGTYYSESWLCLNKPGVTEFFDGLLNILLTDPAYAGLAGIDFAEPQWGFPWGNVVCWCASCRATFEAAHPGAEFGKSDLSGLYQTASPAISVWEQWRADVLTEAMARHIATVKAAGKIASVVSFFGIDLNGKHLSLKWKLKLEGLDIDGVLNHAHAPDEFVWQLTWQEKAAGIKQYVTITPEATEHFVRWALALNNGRATPIVHIGAYSTVAKQGTDFSYGYDHTLTPDELSRAYQAAMKGGARHLEGYALHTIERESLWAGIDAAYASETYHSVLLEVQKWDGSAWRPVGEQAWHRPRVTPTRLAHFARLASDRIRIVAYPAPYGDRYVHVSEAEVRQHSIHDGEDTIWGGMDFDNKEGGTADLWMIRWTPSQAYMHRIDEQTGMNTGGGPWAFSNYRVQSFNDLCVLPVGEEPRILVIGQGDQAARAELHRYSTQAPGTLAGEYYLYLGAKLRYYAGITYQPSEVDGRPYLVVMLNGPDVGQAFHWLDLDTMEVIGSVALSEYSWMWGSGICWAGTGDLDFLMAEYGGSGCYVLRRAGKLQDHAAANDISQVVRWQQETVDLIVHPEKALSVSTTSSSRLRTVAAYTWAGMDYGVSAVTAKAVAADGRETELGALRPAGSWGNVRKWKLDLANRRPEAQTIKLSFMRASGATYIGVLEAGGTLA